MVSDEIVFNLPSVASIAVTVDKVFYRHYEDNGSPYVTEEDITDSRLGQLLLQLVKS